MSDPVNHGGMMYGGQFTISAYSRDRTYEILVTSMRRKTQVITDDEAQQIIAQLNGSISITQTEVKENKVVFQAAPNQNSVAVWARDVVARILSLSDEWR